MHRLAVLPFDAKALKFIPHSVYMKCVAVYLTLFSLVTYPFPFYFWMLSFQILSRVENTSRVGGLHRVQTLQTCTLFMKTACTSEIITDANLQCNSGTHLDHQKHTWIWGWPYLTLSVPSIKVYTEPTRTLTPDLSISNPVANGWTSIFWWCLKPG